jgi:hypothetical protein
MILFSTFCEFEGATQASVTQLLTGKPHQIVEPDNFAVLLGKAHLRATPFGELYRIEFTEITRPIEAPGFAIRVSEKEEVYGRLHPPTSITFECGPTSLPLRGLVITKHGEHFTGAGVDGEMPSMLPIAFDVVSALVDFHRHMQQVLS